MDKISVLILTYNEARNIKRTLAALEGFSEIFVLDSGSTDDTIDIVAAHSNVRLMTRPFDQHGKQWSFGLTQCGIKSPWILALDADYVLSAELVDEIKSLNMDDAISGYRTQFRYSIYGRILSATLYPPVTTLYRRERAHYIQEGHTHRVVIDGDVDDLHGRIIHDDRKPLDRWMASQQKYAKLEADYILGKPQDKLRRMDRIRRKGWLAPLLILPYTLFIKRCIFDGWAGWFYALQRTLAEIMIAIEIIDRRLRS